MDGDYYNAISDVDQANQTTLDRDVNLIDTCDHIVMYNEWRKSKVFSP